MKKLLALVAFIALFACENNNDDEDTCENKVWNMSTNGGSYFASYGPTSATAGTVVVNEATYDFYTAQGNVTDGSICWEGTKN